MPTTQRRHHLSLIRSLIEQPQRFQFFQAMRVLDLWLRRGAPHHGRTLDSVLRFQNSVSLGFPPSQIEALSVDADVPVDDDSALQAALEQRFLRRIRLTPAFMGFLGIHGVLPYDYTDTIAAQIHFDKNEGGRAFFDTFSHRTMTLFYRAWEKCRVEYRVDDQGRDGFLQQQLALAGRQTTLADRRRQATTTAAANVAVAAPAAGLAGGDERIDDGFIGDEVAARYAALLRHRPLPADVIAGVLSEYFDLPFRLDTFVGGWQTQRPEDRTRLGVHNSVLGVNMMIGTRYWRHDLCVRLWIGPLCQADFDRFLPNGSASKALRSMLALFAVPALCFEVRPLLRQADVRPMTLGGPGRLGYDAIMLTRPPSADLQQARYHINF
jgi:type VI secretion system protein ImpH